MSRGMSRNPRSSALLEPREREVDVGPGYPPDLPRAHPIPHKTALHRETVRVNHFVLTAALCVSAVISSTRREVKRLIQRHTAVRAEHAFLCVQVYPCVSSAHIPRVLFHAWHLPRGALGMGGGRPMNRYKPWPGPWDPGP